MPAFITHELLGPHVYQVLPKSLQNIIDRHPSAYFWGLQGPDLLFFRDIIKGKSPLPVYGAKMHSELTKELFEELGNAITENSNSPKGEILLSYVMGFIGHYALDITAHPYIFFLQAREEENNTNGIIRGIHNRIECDIDTVLYQKKHGQHVNKYKPSKKMLGTPATHEPISELYARILWRVYGIKVKKSEIMFCFSDARKMFFFMLDPLNGLVLNSVRIYEKLIKKPNYFSSHIRRKNVEEDVLNLTHQSWHNLNIPDLDDSRDFIDLFSQATEKSKELIISLHSWLQNAHPGHFPPDKMVSFDYGASMTPSLK